MDPTYKGDDPTRFDAYEHTAEFQVVLAVAEALREEFGITIDAHPGGEGTEAGVVNRALRAAARRILQGTVTPPEDLPLVLTWALRRAALRRLVEHGVDEGRAEGLIDLEPGLGDRWLAYLALAPTSVVDDLLAGPAGE
jgi:hypothetical protein